MRGLWAGLGVITGLLLMEFGGGYQSQMFLIVFPVYVAIGLGCSRRTSIYAAVALAVGIGISATPELLSGGPMADLAIRLGLLGATASLFALPHHITGWLTGNSPKFDSRFRDLANFTTAQLVVFDQETGEIVFANDAAARVRGLEFGDELVGALDHDPVQSALLEGSLGPAAHGPDVDGSFVRIDAVDGPATTIEVDARAGIFDGRPAVFSTGVDVTARESIQRARLEAEAKYRAIVENAPVGVLTHQKGVIGYINAVAAGMIGYSEAELEGRALWEFVLEEDIPIIQAGIERRATGQVGRLTYEEIRLRHKDGSIVHLQAHSTIVQIDSEPTFLVIGVDITGRTRAELARAEAEIRYRAIVDNSPVGVLIHQDGEIVFSNRAAAATLGYAPEELPALSVKDIIAPDDLPRVEEGIRKRATGDRSTFRYELDALTKDGARLNMEAVTSIIQIDGKPASLVITADLTDRKRAKRLTSENSALATASRAKDEFMSSMSHELRTPLNSILGFAELLEIDTNHPLVESQRPFIHQIRKAGRHLLDLVDDILDLSRIEAGNMSLSLESVSMPEVAEEVLAVVTPLAVQGGISLHSDLDSLGPHYAIADRTRLKQVLLNLFTNAIKYNRPDGSVTLRMRLDDEAHLRIEVSDTGAGIAREDWDRLFDPFDRLGREGSETTGTGIGLAITKRLVNAMGGNIELESTVGGGSTFSVTMPVSNDPQDAPKAVESATEPDETDSQKADPNHTVLYVEDNPANITLIEAILTLRPNLKVLTAPQGEIGLDLARAHLPDLILLDLHLPDLSGDEVYSRLRADDRTRSIPVVALSADAMPNQIKKSLAMGFDAYITKPVEIDKFLATIDDLLARSG